MRDRRLTVNDDAVAVNGAFDGETEEGAVIDLVGVFSAAGQTNATARRD